MKGERKIDIHITSVLQHCRSIKLLDINEVSFKIIYMTTIIIWALFLKIIITYILAAVKFLWEISPQDPLML